MSIADLAATERLLVVSDFDGTLAGLNLDPMNVQVNTEATEILAQLAQLPNTFVSVLSGRSLYVLQQLCPLEEPVQLVGSHGAESAHSQGPSAQCRAALAAVADELHDLAGRAPGIIVEEKPFHVVFHVAQLAAKDPDRASQLLAVAAGVPAGGTTVSGGKDIVEFSATNTTKGSWIAEERARLGATAVFFAGDDTTDEDGFAVLGPQDLGVKIGEGETRAHISISFEEYAALLQELLKARSAQV